MAPKDEGPRASSAGRTAAAFIARIDLCRRWGISRATSYRYEREGYLPSPVRFGPGVARWPLAEIQAIEARAADDRGGRKAATIPGATP